MGMGGRNFARTIHKIMGMLMYPCMHACMRPRERLAKPEKREGTFLQVEPAKQHCAGLGLIPVDTVIPLGPESRQIDPGVYILPPTRSAISP